MAWIEIAVDGEPPSDMSGNVALYQVYDANADTPTVMLTGRFNDTWMYGLTPTHWQDWLPSVDPVTDPGIWTEVLSDGSTNPPDLPTPTFCEIYDGVSTGTNAWYLGRWIGPVEVTHWKLPTLDAAP